MIGTALTASAKVDMQFRDGLVTSPDFGGHFMTYIDDATGVMTAKSIHAGTTYQDILNYCHEYQNDANKTNLNVELWLTMGGGMDENGFWNNNIANPVAGPRYLRTKKPASGTWADNGFTADHKYLSFAYKTNTPNANITIYWQAKPGTTTPHQVPMTVSDDWQTALIEVAPTEEWYTTEENYMWMVFDSWQDSQNEIVLEVKDLAFLTPEEAGIEPEPPVPGTEPGELTAPIPFVFSAVASFRPDINSWDVPFWWIGQPAGGNALLSQHFVATIPATASILEFDYKASEAVGPFVIYAAQNAESNPDPRIPNAGGPGIGLTPIAIVNLPATDYSMIEDPEDGWSHVEINMITFKNKIGDVESTKMDGVHKGDFQKAKFAQKAGSGDYIQIQAQGYINETEFYLRNFQLVDDPAGIEGVAADEASEVVSSEYFDLQGRQLKAAPEAGLYLRRDIRANGTANTVKVVR